MTEVFVEFTELLILTDDEVLPSIVVAETEVAVSKKAVSMEELTMAVFFISTLYHQQSMAFQTHAYE